jgi:3-methyladenine DNA glycosylase AlkD
LREVSDFNASDVVQRVTQALRAHANPQLALQMKAYLRGQFEFLGIQTPTRRQACKPLLQPSTDPAQLLQIAHALWRLPEREYRYVAIDVLAKNVALFQPHDLPSLKTLLQNGAWWETVDGLSGVIGDVVRLKQQHSPSPQSVMDTWLDDEDFWVRRSAMIHQLGWRLQTDTERLSHYALKLSGESEFFIRKAIGWALRDYAKWHPEWVARFMAQHGSSFSGLTRREALKNLRSFNSTEAP